MKTRHDDDFFAAMTAHPAGKHRQPDRSSDRAGQAESLVFMVTFFVIIAMIVGVVAAQIWHATGWTGLGLTALVLAAAVALLRRWPR